MKIYRKDENFLMLDEPIKIVLTDVAVPFGIEKFYNDYTCKITLNHENYVMFNNIENTLRENIDEIDNELELKSQLEKYKDYKYLRSKLYMIKGNILTEILDEHSQTCDKESIGRKRVDAIVTFDRLWVKDKIAYYKWKILYIKKRSIS